MRFEERQPQPAVCIETTTSDIGGVLPELLPAAFGWVGEQGGSVTGAPFVRYLDANPPRFRIQAGVPTASLMTGEGRVSAITLPGGQIAIADHYGPYERLGETHTAIGEFIAREGRQAAGPAWESYISDPGAEPDVSKLHTEVCYPVSG
jgi:AraC family transcriptional regulator